MRVFLLCALPLAVPVLALPIIPPEATLSAGDISLLTAPHTRSAYNSDDTVHGSMPTKPMRRSMRDKFLRQVTGTLCLVRGYGDTCMRECGPEPVRIECARRPGVPRFDDRPVAGTRWQSARTPNTRGHADREDGSVRAEGAGAHLWDHHDHLQRSRRPRSRQPEGLGCRPSVSAKYDVAGPQHQGLIRPSKRLLGSMEGYGVHAPEERFGVHIAPSPSSGCKTRGGAPGAAMRSVGRFRGTLDTSYVSVAQVASCTALRIQHGGLLRGVTVLCV